MPARFFLATPAGQDEKVAAVLPTRTPSRRVTVPMGEIVDLDAYRAAQRQRQREEAKRKDRSRSLADRGEASNTKPDAEPLEDDPA